MIGPLPAKTIPQESAYSGGKRVYESLGSAYPGQDKSYPAEAAGSGSNPDENMDCPDK